MFSAIHRQSGNPTLVLFLEQLRDRSDRYHLILLRATTSRSRAPVPTTSRSSTPSNTATSRRRAAVCGSTS